MTSFKLAKARKTLRGIGIWHGNYYHLDLNSLSIDRYGNTFINVHDFITGEYISTVMTDTFTTWLEADC